MNRDEILHYLGFDDQINPPCEKCGGVGRRTYASTATWRGGIGGQTLTDDVCDGCWGSGSKIQPWADRRLLAGKIESIRTALEKISKGQHLDTCENKYGTRDGDCREDHRCWCFENIAREALDRFNKAPVNIPKQQKGS